MNLGLSPRPPRPFNKSYEAGSVPTPSRDRGVVPTCRDPNLISSPLLARPVLPVLSTVEGSLTKGKVTGGLS